MGARLDALCERYVQNHKISHWAPATVIEEIFDNEIVIQFDNESPSHNRRLDRVSQEIAFPGKFADDFDWRYKIQVNDTFDCLDSEGVWYKSTCLDARTVNAYSHNENKAIEIQEIYVGFRVYEEEGHKIDDDGRKYTGWSNKYDEWMTRTSPTVQRVGTMIKHYKVAGKQTMIYDNTVDDLSDPIYNTSKRTIWAVDRIGYLASMKAITEFMNTFGEEGGFEKILTVLNKSSNLSMKHYSLLINLLSMM